VPSSLVLDRAPSHAELGGETHARLKLLHASLESLQDASAQARCSAWLLLLQIHSLCVAMSPPPPPLTHLHRRL
jgi:hypothetical protein